MEPEGYYTIMYAEDGNLNFPVEFDKGDESDLADDKIIIKPFVYKDGTD